MSEWQLSARAMTRSFKSILWLLRDGIWTLDDAHKWCDAVLNNDAKYLNSIRADFEKQLANKGRG